MTVFPCKAFARYICYVAVALPLKIKRGAVPMNCGDFCCPKYLCHSELGSAQPTAPCFSKERGLYHKLVS